MFKQLSVLFFLCGYTSIIWAQQNDTSANARTKTSTTTAADIHYVEESNIPFGNGSLTGIDTAIEGFQHYNILFQENRNYASTGNLGSPGYNLTYQGVQDPGVDLILNQQFPHFLSSDKIRYYRTPSPYSELTYMNAQLKEQLLSVVHSQNVRPRWNVGLNFNRIDAIGYYKRQRTNFFGFDAFSWYQSRSSRYNLYVNTIVNRQRWEENGGVTDQDLFKRPQERDHLYENIHSLLAQNKVFSYEANVLQTLDFGKKDTVQEKGKSFQRFIPRHRLAYKLGASRTQSIFTDALPTVADYAAIYAFGADTSLVLDSFQVDRFQQELSLASVSAGDTVFHHWEYALGLQQGMAKHSDLLYLPRYLNNYGYSALLAYRLNKHVKAFARQKTAFMDQGKVYQEYKYTAGISLNWGEQELELLSSLASNTPDFMYNRSSSATDPINHSLSTSLKAFCRELNYRHKAWKLGLAVKQYTLQNVQYWSRTSTSSGITPAYLPGPVSLSQFIFYKDFKLGKFGLDNYLVYQKSTIASKLFLPEWYLHHMLYYTDRWFKVLAVKIGFELRYNSDYELPVYSALARVYYREEYASVKANNYPIVDFLIAARLKRARILVRLDHLNQGLFEKRGYFSAQAYPMPDRVLKFGVSWRFYD